ncbi:glutathione S-transferase C-terminal-like protein [Dacryopinax primogenitus]|uniref:Glutathione S-transferase C-terminal-like protein n=1 Tax=Dacryopinax primogenitus (strain DJM 731) TaxID=1858805 RepID=M5G1R1_DACPD|nr:glutathione S-transferase C-terminal-like protein [Dacryopinax primogenitus]EJT97672.1 glutathione S-transferase C-terminal-like protein [Dacryopinax primogenitus]
MSHGKQFTLYAFPGPTTNGWKVAHVLSELGLTYEMIFLDYFKNEHRTPEFLKLNPNGRIPALIDHGNNDFSLWESNAILMYLVDQYDKEHRLSADTNVDQAIQDQWLLFQASGHDAYTGQWAWFAKYTPDEKVPQAIERYKKETEHIMGVLESVLSKQEWLVGGKITIADISFIAANDQTFTNILGLDYSRKMFPAVYKWHTAMISRPAIKGVDRERTVSLG